MAQQKQLSKDKQEAILKRFLPGIHRWQQDYKHGMDGKRAAAALRRFDRQDKQGVLTDKYGGKHRVYDAGGMIGSSEIDSIRNADGERIHSHDLEFHRKGTGGSAYDKTKRPMTDAKRDTRQKIIKHMMGRLMDNVPDGDQINAYAVNETEGKPNARARIYDRMTKGALKGQSDGVISTTKLSPTKWMREHDYGIKKFDPKTLMSPLAEQAARVITKRLSHPIVQAALTLDDASMAVLPGHKRASKHLHEQYQQQIEPAILKRLKGGHRVTPVSPLSYR